MKIKKKNGPAFGGHKPCFWWCPCTSDNAARVPTGRVLGLPVTLDMVTSNRW